MFFAAKTFTLGADFINSINAPESVVQGTTVSVEVSYAASTDRDILIIFQMNTSPWTQFGYERISVAEGSSTLLIPLAIDAATPIATDIYKFSISLLPGAYGGWHDRLVARLIICWLDRSRDGPISSPSSGTERLIAPGNAAGGTGAGGGGE